MTNKNRINNLFLNLMIVFIITILPCSSNSQDIYKKRSYSITKPSDLYKGNQLRKVKRLTDCRDSVTHFCQSYQMPFFNTNCVLDDKLVEVRGWIVSDIKPTEEAEYVFDLLLDYEWITKMDSDSVTPLASIKQIVPYITPYSIISLGKSDRSFLFNSAKLDSSGKNRGGQYHYGGSYSHVIHVEAMGFKECECCPLEPCKAPTDWNVLVGGHSCINPHPSGERRWSFDLFKLDSYSKHQIPKRGTYVRIVGLIWQEDNRHAHSHNKDEQIKNDAVKLWPSMAGAKNQDRTKGNITEIHPVNYMAILPEPLPKDSQLEFITFCDRIYFNKRIELQLRKPKRNENVIIEKILECNCDEYISQDDSFEKPALDSARYLPKEHQIEITFNTYSLLPTDYKPYFHRAYKIYYKDKKSPLGNNCWIVQNKED